MATEFNLIISSCRKSYAAFQQLAGRTDDALYHALGDLHALRFRMRNEPVLRAEFDELLQMNGGKSTNETLFLAKYVFFPHTLQPGPGHKSDITKASRYAKLINKALDQRIQPADFVPFARQQGIQRTALASRTSKRPPIRTTPPQSRKPSSSSSSVTGTASFIGPILAPLEPWSYSHALATRLADVVRRAVHQRQQLLLTVYVNSERAVFTDIAGKPWNAAFPAGAIRVARPAPARLAAVPKAPPKQPPRPCGPRLGLPRRSMSLSPTRRGRQRLTADENLRILAQAMIGVARRGELWATDFLKYADILALLSRDELILLGRLMVDDLDFYSSPRPPNSGPNLWKQVIVSLIPTFPTKEDVADVAAGAQRSGFLVPITGLDGTHYGLSPEGRSVRQIVDIRAALSQDRCAL